MKMIRFLFLCELILCMLLSGIGYCKDSDPHTMDAVVVTAERIQEDFKTGDVDQETVSAFQTRIERDQFEGKTDDLAEIIEKEAGIQVRQTGGLGGFSSVSLRGSTGEQVMVYLDGILLNDASGGGADLSNISLADVESVEIYKSTSPIQFGKASIGGVVHIKTLRNKKKLTAGVSAGYGSFDTRTAAGFINHSPLSWEKLDVLVSFDYLESENDFDILNDGGTEWNTGDDRWEKSNNAQFDQANLLAKIGVDLSDLTRLDIANQWFQKYQGLPSWNNSDQTDTTFDTRRNITTVQLTADDISPFHINTRTRLDYSFKTEEYDDSEGHIGLGNQHSEYDTRRFGASFFAEWLSDFQIMSLVLDYWHETYQPEDLLRYQNLRDSIRNAFGVGLQDSFLFFGEKLVISPALRFTVIRDELESTVSNWDVPLTSRTRNEAYWQPQFGVKYRLSNEITVKSNIAKYIREPSFFELFGDRGFFMGNDDLNAEEGFNADVGFSFEKGFDHPMARRLSIGAACFISDVDNLITRVYDARGIGKSDNISESSVRGVEANLVWNFFDYFSLSGNATWQDSENQSDIGHFNGKSLPGRFEQSYFVKFEARYAGFKGYLEYSVEKDMFYDTANLLKADDKEEINAGLSWLFKNQWLFTLEGKNLSDDLYEDFNGYPRPGKSFFASVKYTY